MPYKLRKAPGRELYWVIGEDGTHKSKDPMPKDKAMAQMRALYANANDLKGGSWTDFLNPSKIYNEIANPDSVLRRRVADVSKGIRTDYPPHSRKVLDMYGDKLIEQMAIRRIPIQSALHSAFELITLGQWSKARAETNKDKLFHLGLVLTVRDNNGARVFIVVEKNEVVNVAITTQTTKGTDGIKILAPLNTTLRTFLNRGLDAVGADKFFKYDPFTNNCQDFIAMLLSANGIYTPEAQAFTKQPIDDLLAKLPGWTSKVAKGITDLGGIASVAVEGAGRKRLKGGMTPEEKAAAKAKQRAALLAEREALRAAQAEAKAKLQATREAAAQDRGKTALAAIAQKKAAEAQEKAQRKSAAVKPSTLRGRHQAAIVAARAIEVPRVENAEEARANKRANIQRALEAARLFREEEARRAAEALAQEKAAAEARAGKIWTELEAKKAEYKHLNTVSGNAENGANAPYWDEYEADLNQFRIRPQSERATYSTELANRKKARDLAVSDERVAAARQAALEYHSRPYHDFDQIIEIPYKTSSGAIKIYQEAKPYASQKGVRANDRLLLSKALLSPFYRGQKVTEAEVAHRIARLKAVGHNREDDEPFSYETELENFYGRSDPSKRDIEEKMMADKWHLSLLDKVPDAEWEGTVLGRGKRKPKVAESPTPSNPLSREEYLSRVRAKAKSEGYPYKLLGFANDGVHKFQIPNADGKIIKFGREGYGDFIIWSALEKSGKTKKGKALQKRRVFHNSHNKIKGDWRSDLFSPNNLALRILW